MLRRKRLGGALFGVLLAVNAAVIIYHGDPREHAAAPAADGPKRRAHQRRAPGEAAALGVDVTRGFAGRHLDPMVGLRTPGAVQRVEVVKLGSGETVARALGRVGLGGAEVASAIDSLTTVVDFRRLRPGNKLMARLDGAGALVSLGLAKSLAEEVQTTRGPGGWRAERLEIPVETSVTQVVGTVRSTLWESFVGLGEEPALISEFADVFAWEVDFYRDVRVGDAFKMLVEKRYARGKFAGYGSILAAEYKNDGHPLRAFAVRRDDGTVHYYSEAGESLRKQLLKTPLQYGRMTSGFGSRRHPVLGYTRAHNGVDYGVPTGTPVWSVGDGRVVKAGWNNGFGKLIEVSHANGWLSQYAHLSSIDVKVGQRISQKQIIGRTGNTGMSTGPHLHYGLKKNGSYVNPDSQKFERAKALEGPALDNFKKDVARLSLELDRIQLAAGLLATHEG